MSKFGELFIDSDPVHMNAQIRINYKALPNIYFDLGHEITPPLNQYKFVPILLSRQYELILDYQKRSAVPLPSIFT